MEKRKEIFVLSGFLGAGKTTFLKNLLRYYGDKRIGIIMNEFGKVGIDGTLVKKDGIEVLELNQGSIFCSCLKGDFVDGIIAYAALPIDYLFIEGSGLADPSNMLEILRLVEKRLSSKVFRYRGSICIVDAVHFIDYLNLFNAIEKQVKNSSIVILNKVDLANREIVEETKAAIREINAKTLIVPTTYCEFDLEFLESAMEEAGIGDEEASCNVPENKPRTFVLMTEEVIEKEPLTTFLGSLQKDAYRVKGFAQTPEGWVQIDVAGNQIEIKATDIVQEMTKIIIISSVGLPIVRNIFTSWEEHMKGIKMVLR